MKKLFCLSIMFLGIGICIPTEAKATEKSAMVVSQEKEYKKITPEEVNKEALMNIKAKYGDYQIVEAAVAADGEYKLVLKKDNAALTALFTSAGDLIKIL